VPSASAPDTVRRRPALFWLRFPDEATACLACASPRLRLVDVIPVPRDGRGRRVSFIAGCRECGLLFANPPRPRDELERYYSPDGPWAVSHAERMKRVEAKYLKRLTKNRPPKPRQRRGARDLLLDAFEPHVDVHHPGPGAKALDFGCGDGKFLDRLQAWGWDTFGIEPSTQLAFLRHHRLEVPPQDGSCDLVILHHVLEHMPEPLAVLRALAGALREGGALFVSVPNLDAVARHGDRHYCINARTHIVSFSETCLRGLLARAGFAVAARLNHGLDEVLTEGKPLRLRLLATRTSAPLPLPREPLMPAVRALRAWARANGGSRFANILPVRMRAALMDRARERSRGRRAEG